MNGHMGAGAIAAATQATVATVAPPADSWESLAWTAASALLGAVLSWLTARLGKR